MAEILALLQLPVYWTTTMIWTIIVHIYYKTLYMMYKNDRSQDGALS